MREVKLGDETMSVLEIWGAEYQENDCLLIKPEDRQVLETMCSRERCSLQVRWQILVSQSMIKVEFPSHYCVLSQQMSCVCFEDIKRWIHVVKQGCSHVLRLRFCHRFTLLSMLC